MAARDGFSNFKFFQALAPTEAGIEALTNGADVDTRGYDTVVLIANVGKASGINSTSHWCIKMQHADASAGGASNWADCTSADLILLASMDTASTTSGCWASIYSADLALSTTYIVGYRGTKRYVRCVVYSEGSLHTGTTLPSTIFLGVTAVLGLPANWPVNTGS